jgi:hypothetical protein
VEAVEPAVVGVAAIGGATEGDRHGVTVTPRGVGGSAGAATVWCNRPPGAVDPRRGAVDDRAMDARARRWARVSVGAGAVVLLLAVVSALLPQPRPCGDLPDRYPPIIAFELARDGRDLVALFGPPGACRDRMIAAMDTANVVDLAAFLPAYALFLAAWFACRRGAAPARRGWARRSSSARRWPTCWRTSACWR